MHRTKLFPDSAVEYSSSREFDKTRSDCEVYIPDCHRSARLSCNGQLIWVSFLKTR
jgi:hypothetical protein